jgi:ankyrin repeat protein
VNAKNKRRQTILTHLLVRNECPDEDFLNHLIEALPLHVLRSKDTRGNSALHYLVMKKNLSAKCYEAFLDRDKSLGSIRNASGAIPLFFASAAHNVTALNVLIPFERNVNAIDSQGDNALIYAMSSGLDLIESVSVLIKAGVKMESVSLARCKLTGEIQRVHALDIACKLSLLNIAHELIRHGSKASDAAVHAAAKLGCESFLRCLVTEKKASPNSLIDGMSPLLLACKAGNAECARVLLENGGDLLVRDPSDGETPLHLACESENADLVSLLIESMLRSALDFEDENEDGETALFVAAKLGALSIVKLLVDAGADLNAFNVDGVSLLVTAARNGHQDVVDWLLKRGAIEDVDEGEDENESGVDESNVENEDVPSVGGRNDLNATTTSLSELHHSVSGLELLSIVDAEQSTASEGGNLGLLCESLSIAR